MNKKCTNPSCRKTFSTLHFYGICPYCGKEYPQLISTRKREDFWAVKILDFNHKKVKTVKTIREFFHMGLKEAKEAADHIPDTVFILDYNDANHFILALQEFGCTCKWKPAKSKTVSKEILFPD